MTPSSVRCQLQRLDARGQRLEAVDEVRAQPNRRSSELEADLPRQDLLEQDPDLEACEERTEAEVRATSAERRVWVVPPRHVEPLRILEHVLVEVGRKKPHRHAVARLDRDAPDLRV